MRPIQARACQSVALLNAESNRTLVVGVVYIRHTYTSHRRMERKVMPHGKLNDERAFWFSFAAASPPVWPYQRSELTF